MIIINKKTLNFKNNKHITCNNSVARISTSADDLRSARLIGSEFIQQCNAINATTVVQILENPALDEYRNRILDFNNSAATRDGIIIEVAVNTRHNMVICQYIDSDEKVLENCYNYTEPNPPVNPIFLQGCISDATVAFGGVDFLTEQSRNAFDEFGQRNTNLNTESSPFAEDSAYESDTIFNGGIPNNNAPGPGPLPDNPESEVGTTNNEEITAGVNASTQSEVSPVSRKRSRSSSFDEDEEEDQRKPKRTKKEDDDKGDKGGPSSGAGSLGGAESNTVKDETPNNSTDASLKGYLSLFILEFISNIDITLFLP